MGSLTPKHRRWLILLLLASGWVLLVIMLVAVIQANTRFRLVLLGSYVGILFLTNILVVVFRATISHIGHGIFSKTPDFLVFFFTGLMIVNLAVLYVAFYRFYDLRADLGILATLMFSVAIFLSLPSDMFKFILPRFVMVAISVCIAVIAVEIFLANYGTYQVLESNANTLFIPAEGVLPGVEGEARFVTDQYGIQGDPYDSIDENAYRILAIGGSTTATLYLDIPERWPYQIQILANEDEKSIWVGNVGGSGHKTLDHYAVLKDFVPQFDLDMVIMLVGVNDLQAMIDWPERELINLVIPEELAQVSNAGLSNFAQTNYRTAEWRFGALASMDLLAYNIIDIFEKLFNSDSVFVEDEAGIAYVARRQLRQATTPVYDTLPDRFDEGLSIYRENLISLIEEAQDQGITLVFMTQPHVWSESLSEEFEKYLWAGVIRNSESLPIGRYTVGALGDGMNQYNRVLLSVCEEYNVPCIDLAAELSEKTEYFYDSMHFNEAGSNLVANIIWDVLEDLIE